ncbi:MAG: N-acetyltransferase [Bacteroidales bacterium]|nr:N-acetyltransferase [Bacteroidales bacterium]
MPITVKEVSTSKELRAFYKFQNRLYRKCKVYVPTLDMDQRNSLTKDPALKYCKRKLFLAYDESGKVVGRVQGIINPRYNDYYSLKRVRFGWLDFIEDEKVAQSLVEAVEKWGASEGMTEIHGPLAYNTMGRQGMLVEGFDKMPQANCLYNYPYYVDYMEKMGFEKECDWVQFEMDPQQGLPEKLGRISKLLMEKYELRVLKLREIRKNKELKEDLLKQFFALYNDAFKTVHNFIPYTEEEQKEIADHYFPYMRDGLTCMVVDKDNNLVSFGVSIPSLSRALKRANGKLFPIGWFFILLAFIRFKVVDLMLIGSAPAWQSKGLSSILHTVMEGTYYKLKLKSAISNPQLEDNNAIKVWDTYNKEPYMRRRCWIRKIQ